MIQFVDKFGKIKEKVTKKFGKFVLFGLFLPEGESHWDLVLSAPWLKSSDMTVLKSISHILNQVLGDDMMKLSRFVVLEPTNSFVKSVLASIRIRSGSSEFIHCEFDGLHFKHAFIITPQKKVNDSLHMKTRSKEERVAA